MNNKIQINGKEYNVKNTLRAMFIYEQISKKPFKIETLLDNYIYLYSIILANNNDNIIEWNEFIDALDSDPSIYEQLNDILIKGSKVEELFSGNDDEKDEKKN